MYELKFGKTFGMRISLFIWTIAVLGIAIIAVTNLIASGETLYVDDSGGEDYTIIQDAINNSVDGDTIIVFEGTYIEDLNVNKSISLIGDDPSNTLIEGDEEGNVVMITADWVNMSGFTVIGSGNGMNDPGIEVESSNNHLFNLNCSSNYLGILVESSWNRISDSSFWNNTHGVDIRSSNNTIYKNTFTENFHGIHVFDSYSDPSLNNNTVASNLLSSNNYGIYFSKTEYSIISDNAITLSGYYGVYLIRSSWIVLDNNTCSLNGLNGIGLSVSEDCIIKYNTLYENENGVFLGGANRNSIYNNSIFENTRGIYLLGVKYNSIYQNIITENRAGISLSYLGDDNIVHHNLIYDNIKLAIDGVHANTNKKVLDAPYNWWGSEFGPYHAKANWNGRGDNVTDNVDFDPWIGKEITVKYVDDDAPNDGDGTIEHPFNKIQDGIDKVVESGIVYVLEGHYYEQVKVNKKVALFGNSSINTIIDGEDSGIPVLITADKVRLSGFRLINSGDNHAYGGITIFSDKNRIYNNDCSENDGNGIRLFFANDNTIFDNSFSSNQRSGATVEFSDNNFFNNNTFYSNEEYGVHISSSKENRIANGNCSENLDGIRVTSLSSNNHVMSIKCISNTRYGFYFEKSDKNIISDSSIMENEYGISFMKSSKDNIVHYNNIYNNEYNGIDVLENDEYMVIATDNWWGNGSGPYHPVKNPSSDGEKVTDYVSFDPWNGKNDFFTKFLNDDAPDGGDGSLDHPFNNIQEAVDAANTGETVRFMEGKYQLMKDGVYVDKQIKLIGSGPKNTIVQGYGGFYPDHQHLFCILEDECIVTGFQFRWAPIMHEMGAAIGLYSSGNQVFDNVFNYNYVSLYLCAATNNIIRNNLFYYSSWHIRDDASSNNLFENNVFRAGPYHGWDVIDLKGSSYNTFIGNSFFANTGAGLRHSGDYNKYYDNEFYSNNGYGISIGGYGNRLINNTFKGHRIGIQMTSEKEDVINYNVITENIQGIVIRGSSDDTIVQYNQIFNNTKYGIDATGIDGGNIDARYNWWGHATGPFQSLKNPDGKGDNVTDNVIFDNWSKWSTYFTPEALITTVNPKPALEGETIYFSGNGLVYELVEQYVWNSSIDGEFYYGTEKSFYYNTLSIGTHIIFFRVQDNFGNWSEWASTTLIINGVPIAKIDEIRPDYVNDGEMIWFYGNGTDDGTIEEYYWNSSIDGFLSNKNSFSSSDLSIGTHEINFKVKNNFGIWSESNKETLTVNGIPIALIEKIDPTLSNENEIVWFYGNEKDDGNIEEYFWYSSIDGFLSIDKSYSTTILSPGAHTIYFKVRDNYDVWSSEVSTILTINGIPTAIIEKVERNSIVESETVNFYGSYIDFEDDISEFYWESDISGFLNDKKDFSISNLIIGTHKITFRVKDYFGVWSEDAMETIVINGIPTAKIIKISSDLANIGDMIYFYGEGKDEGTISGFSWSSNIDGLISSENMFTFSQLSLGTHIIEFSVKDNMGTWSEPVAKTIEIKEQEKEKTDELPQLKIMEIKTQESALENQNILIEVKIKDTNNTPFSNYVIIFYCDGKIIENSDYDQNRNSDDIITITTSWKAVIGGHKISVKLLSTDEEILDSLESDFEIDVIKVAELEVISQEKSNIGYFLSISFFFLLLTLFFIVKYLIRQDRTEKK